MLGSLQVTFSIPQTESNALLPPLQHPVSAHNHHLWSFGVFQPAALLTNTSAFCLAHSYFSLFPEL